MFLVIDNYDSFTYNLVQYLGELAVDHHITKELLVKRNDEITLEEIRKMNPDGIYYLLVQGIQTSLAFVCQFSKAYQKKFQH